MNGDTLHFPTGRAERRIITLLVIKGLFEYHLLAEFELPFEVLVLGVERSVFLDEIHDAAIEVEHSAVEFDVLNLVDGIGDFFCVVEDAHINDCRKRKGV